MHCLRFVATAHGAVTFASLSLCVFAQAQVNRVEMEIAGEFRIIRANGIPDHVHGQFPNRNNPNAIAPQSYEFRMPVHPLQADVPIPLGMHPFGVAINGVPFDPGAAEFWQGNPESGWQYEALGGRMNLGMDQNNAHVQPNGAYHYHGMPLGLVRSVGRGRTMLLIGYAADGFPIYARLGLRDAFVLDSGVKPMKSSYRLRRGTRGDGPPGPFDGTFVQDYEYVQSSGDLDECNGRFGVTPEFPEGTYHYFVTDEFPFIPRYFRGIPDESFLRFGPPRGAPPPFPPPPGGRPPRGLRPPR